MSKFYLGIDIGSFETKGVLVDETFQVVRTSSLKHTMENPAPNYFEHDAEAVWWHDFCEVAKTILYQQGITGEEIAGVGASVLGCDCLPVDQNCKPLRKAILYGIDARCQEEMEWLTRYYGPDGVLQRFGHPICSDDVAAKILWVKNHEPEIFEKTFKFLTGSSYIAAKLTGNYVIDQFLAKAAFRPLYREDGSIDEKECELYCKPDQLCQCRVVTELAGVVTEQAAAETGLKAGTPVIVGSGDSTSEAVSVGIVEPGELMFQFGSSLFFYYCADHKVTDPRVHGGNYTVPGTFSVSGGTNAAGTLTRWVRDTFFFDLVAQQEAGGKDAYAAMMDYLPDSSKGLVCLPYLAGERMPINDPKAKGVLFGLTLEHDRGHIYRAALEAVACSLTQNVRLLESVGLPVEQVIAVGGGTKNEAWMQIVADVLGKPIVIPEVTVGASYGDALMAALGTGALESFAQLKSVVRTARSYLPNPRKHQEYQSLMEVYDALYPATRELMYML